MNLSDWISLSGIVVPLFVAVAGGVLLIAYKIGQLHNLVTSMYELVKRIPKIEVELAEIRVKVDVLWQKHMSEAKSPLALNDDGSRILKTSGIDLLMRMRYGEIVDHVIRCAPKNVYQVQECLIKICYAYKEDATWKHQLEVAAFQSGCDVGTILFVGSLNIRDKVIRDLGFNPEKPDELPTWVAA